ncbi:MAG: hypothetical protein OQK12_18195, partial [Motiliproteus sp.]|nr:hypothetical protein [Motiliproteus sp.]
YEEYVTDGQGSWPTTEPLGVTCYHEQTGTIVTCERYDNQLQNRHACLIQLQVLLETRDLLPRNN